MKQLFYCLLCSAAIACNSAADKVSNDTTTTGYSDSAVQVADSTHPPGKRDSFNYKIDTSVQVTKTLLPPADTLITVDIQNGKGSTRAYLSGMGKHVTLIIPVTNGDSLTAEIIPDDNTLNIRFKQVYVPAGKNGKYDGPFSRTIRYPITVKGKYKLIIGSDLMADGKPKGSFTCNVLIK